MPDKPQHGGKREGAGMKAGPEGVKDRRTVRISEAKWQYLLKQKGGASAHIDRLITTDIKSATKAEVTENTPADMERLIIADI